MDAFMANPKIVWEWYKWRRELMAKVKPNPGHYALVELAKSFAQFTVVTQNVDGLHRLAGSDPVLELHGNIYRNKCSKCDRQVQVDQSFNPADLPVCSTCGGKIRPDVVWFGEMLPESEIDEAFRVSEEADIFFSIGTSAIVHPAASLPLVAKRHGATLVEINPEETPLTSLCDYHFSANSGEILPSLVALLRMPSADSRRTGVDPASGVYKK